MMTISAHVGSELLAPASLNVQGSLSGPSLPAASTPLATNVYVPTPIPSYAHLVVVQFAHWSTLSGPSGFASTDLMAAPGPAELDVSAG